jgi:hypothetical protein
MNAKNKVYPERMPVRLRPRSLPREDMTAFDDIFHAAVFGLAVGALIYTISVLIT